MRFEEVATSDAAGAILAHTHRLRGSTGDGADSASTGVGASAAATLKKGRVLTAADCAALAEAGATRVTVARLDEGDLIEDDAARAVAEAAAGPHVDVARPATGRANGFAKVRGVLVAARERIDAVNLVDEAITIATLPPFSVVEIGAMVFTVKVIPFAVPSAIVARASQIAAAGGPLARIAPLRPKRAGLVMTTLPGVAEEQLARAAKSQAQRMAYLGGEVAREVRAEHDAASVAAAIEGLLAEGLDLVLVLGASAIVDSERRRAGRDKGDRRGRRSPWNACGSRQFAAPRSPRGDADRGRPRVRAVAAALRLRLGAGAPRRGDPYRSRGHHADGRGRVARGHPRPARAARDLRDGDDAVGERERADVRASRDGRGRLRRGGARRDRPAFAADRRRGARGRALAEDGRARTNCSRRSTACP